MKACPGLRLPLTSSPTAFAFTASMNVFTTGSATSASRSATRTSQPLDRTRETRSEVIEHGHDYMRRKRIFGSTNLAPMRENGGNAATLRGSRH